MKKGLQEALVTLQISATLKNKLKQVEFEGEINVRLHRAISWLKAAEENEGNTDIIFICLWISFNSCYGIDHYKELSTKEKINEKNSISRFLSQLILHDRSGQIHELLWKRFSSEIKLLIENEFLFKPFWDFQRGENIKYQQLLDKSIVNANSFLGEGRVPEFLEIVLDRLYILRNQLFHGGSTYKGSVNRQQVKDGSRMLKNFIPIVIEIMISNKEENWGDVYYPVVKTV